jgi:hypothetical protein
MVFLFARINLKFLWFIVANIAMENKGYCYIVDERGSVIAGSNIALEDSVEIKGTQVQVQYEKLVAGDDYRHVYQNLAGRRVISGHGKVYGLFWSVIVEEPLNQAFSPLYRMILDQPGTVVTGECPLYTGGNPDRQEPAGKSVAANPHDC